MWFNRMPAKLRSGWTVVMLVALTLLAAWLPDLTLPLGDSDDGRILARLGLQAENFWDMGPAESGFGARIDPYVRGEFNVEQGQVPPEAAVTYAHHPPLQIFLTILSVGVLGNTVIALRIIGFATGAGTVVLMAALLRVRGLAWGPTLLASAAMACTGFYVVYGRLGVGYSLIIASTALIAYLRDSQDPPRWLKVCAAALAAVTVMQSWIAMAAMALLTLWLYSAKRRSAIVEWVAFGAIFGLVVTAVWMLNATQLAELSDRVAFRSDFETYGFGEFLSRQWNFARQLSPGWLRLIMFPALLAGLADRRTRVPTLITLTVAAAMTFGLQQGAWIHRLWNFPWLAPITIGLAALSDAVRRLLGKYRVAARSAAALTALIVAVTFYGVVTGPTRQTWIVDPADAGAVLEQISEPPASDRIWVTRGTPTARWASYYVDVPVWVLEESRLHQLVAEDLILIRCDRLPDYISDCSRYVALASEGRYRVLSARSLLAAS